MLWMYRCATRLCSQEDDAKDHVQDTLLNAIRRLKYFLSHPNLTLFSSTQEKPDGQVIRLGRNGKQFWRQGSSRASSHGSGLRSTRERADISDPFGRRTKGYGVFTHRNPVSPWSVGEMRLRFAERRAAGLLYQDPPRITLVPPDDGPVGFCGGLLL